MDNKTKARYKDEIVKYLRDKYPMEIYAKDMAKIISNGLLTHQEMIGLCEEIISDDYGVIEKGVSAFIASYVAVEVPKEDFLSTNIYQALENLKEGAEREEKIRDIKRGRKKDELDQLQQKNLELSNQLNKTRLKTHWIPIVISIVGLGVAVASFFRPSNEPSKPVDDNRLQNIEMKMEQLENGLKKDLDSIQNQLYEAQMLIDIYES